MKNVLFLWIWPLHTFCSSYLNESMFQSILGVSWIFGTDFNPIQCKIISWWAFEYKYRELQKNMTSKVTKKVLVVRLIGLLQGPVDLIKVLHDVKSIHDVNRSGLDRCVFTFCRDEMLKPIWASSLVCDCYPVCTEDSCSPTTGETQPSILTEFTRTFTWELTAPKKIAVSLNILGEGLLETTQPCSNGCQYSVTNGKDQTRYCRGGSVTTLDLLDKAVVSLKAKPKAQVEDVLFQASAGPISKKILKLF